MSGRPLPTKKAPEEIMLCIADIERAGSAKLTSTARGEWLLVRCEDARLGFVSQFDALCFYHYNILF